MRTNILIIFVLVTYENKHLNHICTGYICEQISLSYLYWLHICTKTLTLFAVVAYVCKILSHVCTCCMCTRYVFAISKQFAHFICILGLLYQIHCSNPGSDNCRKELFITCPYETDKLYLPRNACNCSEGIVAVLQLSFSIPIIKRYKFSRQ